MTDGKKPLTKIEIIEIVQEMVNVYENLPSEALFAPLTHQDHHTLLLLLLSLLKADVA